MMDAPAAVSACMQAELRGKLVSLSTRLAAREAADPAGAAVAAPHQQDTYQVGLLVPGWFPVLADSLL